MKTKTTKLKTRKLPIVLAALMLFSVVLGMAFAGKTTARAATFQKYQVGIAFDNAALNDKTITFRDVALDMGNGAISLNPTDFTRYRYQTFYMYVWVVEIDPARVVPNGNYRVNGHFLINGVEDEGDIVDNEFPQFIQLYNSTPMPETPTREHYTFGGWYLDKNCTVPYTNEPIFADIALYAKWVIDTFTVTLISNGKTIRTETVDYGTVLSLPQLERTGYIFGGWLLPNGTEYNGETIAADTTLTAKWTLITYTVTFYIGNEVYKTIQVPFGTTLESAMQQADLFDYAAYDSLTAQRVSKFSVLTEDVTVSVQQLSGWEKFGDFVAHNNWLVWGIIALVGSLIGAVVIMAVVIKKRG